MSAPTKARSRSPLWWVVTGSWVFLALFVAIGAIVRERDDSSGMAEYACEDFVEDRLKSPGTADFQNATVESAGSDTWLVTGTVDSENSFGATMRVDYECTVTGSGANWTLVDLQHSQR